MSDEKKTSFHLCLLAIGLSSLEICQFKFFAHLNQAACCAVAEF